MEETNVEENNSPAGGEDVKIEDVKSEVVKSKCAIGACCGKKKHVIASIVLVALIAAGVGVYFYKFKKNDIGLEGAKTKVLDFVNGNLLQPGTTATVKDIAVDNDLYKITITVGGKQDVVTYLTKDGKKFFPEAMDTDVEKKEIANKAPEEDRPIPKNDKPKVDLYVMSFCPFGNQSEDTLKSAYDLLKNKVDFNFHYIVSTNGEEIQSLHGPVEVAQDEREACVLKKYGKDKWFGFVSYVNKNCGKDGACWEAGAKSLGILTSNVSACVAAEGPALMKENEKISKEAGAEGSPTMLINGVSNKVVYQYGNPDAYKQIICSAFNKAPVECAKKLAAPTAAVAPGGSCGN